MHNFLIRSFRRDFVFAFKAQRWHSVDGLNLTSAQTPDLLYVTYEKHNTGLTVHLQQIFLIHSDLLSMFPHQNSEAIRNWISPISAFPTTQKHYLYLYVGVVLVFFFFCSALN